MEALKKLLLITLASSAFARSLDTPVDFGPEATSVIQANGKFANLMYKELSKKDGNVLISPASAHACLSMLYQGTTGNRKEDLQNVLGVTASEAAEGYHSIMHNINNPETANVTIANKIYFEKSLNLKQAFADIVENKFSSEVEGVDFADYEAAADLINRWIEHKTANKIQRLFAEKDLKGALVVLVNTIYFQDIWKYPFYESNTEQEPFYLKDGSTVNVAMMFQINHLPYKEDETLDAKLVKLPYEDSHYSMVIILPNKKDGIAELEQKLLDEDITQITKNLNKAKLRVSLPKFKFSSKMDLENTLSNMGLKSLFDPSSNGFIELVENYPELVVGKALQKVSIQVDEKGSEVAASTAIELIVTATGAIEKEVDFRVDHPFIFLLTHQLDTTLDHQNILFYGRIEKPVFEE